MLAEMFAHMPTYHVAINGRHRLKAKYSISILFLPTWADKKVLGNLDMGKIPELDSISATLLKCVLTYFPSHSTIFSPTGIMPAFSPRCWKTTNVQPTPKKDDLINRANYGPIQSFPLYAILFSGTQYNIHI